MKYAEIRPSLIRIANDFELIPRKSNTDKQPAHGIAFFTRIKDAK